jgi:hypothetical protein
VPLQTYQRRLATHVDWLMLAAGLMIGIGVCAPFFASGRLILLDWSIGPTTPIISSGLLGLNGGLTSGVAGSLLVDLLNWILGSVSTWLPVLLFFPLAFLGVSRLAGGSFSSRLAAGVLYTVNPFDFNRLYVGHVSLLIGYALLPFAVKAAMRVDSPSWRCAIRTALWWSVLTALDAHFAWIYGVVVLVVAVTGMKGAIKRSVLQLGVTASAFFVMSLYILLPHLATNLPTRTGQTSLALYQTTGDPHLGLFANVAGLYGFWRLGPGPTLPKDVISGWPFLLLTVLLIVATGAWAALRRTKDHAGADESSDHNDVNGPIEFDEVSTVQAEKISASDAPDSRSRLAWVLLLLGVVGFLLALGSQGPTGALFAWLYDHVPFFAVMREPQKFLMLLALAYAVFFGWGVEYLSRLAISPKKARTYVMAVGLGIVLPLAYTPTIFDGLNGQVALSNIPPAYQQANAVMGKGEGNILALPWHNYLEYPFTNGRVVANVAPNVFNRNVISGDNVQTGSVATQSTSLRSTYLQSLISRGLVLHHIGALVAPLGVKFIVLAKTVDWHSYSWLSSQSDLMLITDNSSIEVWQNLSYQGIAQPVTGHSSVSRLSDRTRRSNQLPSGFGLVSTGIAKQDAILAGPESTASDSTTSGRRWAIEVQMMSPIAYRISRSAPGWVEISAPYEVGWSMDGVPAQPTAQGSMVVHVGVGGGVLIFTPWRSARLGYFISGATFLLLLASLSFWRTGRVNPEPIKPTEAR